MIGCGNPGGSASWYDVPLEKPQLASASVMTAARALPIA
jgi:hypothetical protein